MELLRTVRQYRLVVSPVLLLAALALCVRLLIPPGYMPSFAAGKSYLTLELCTVHGEQQTILIDLETGKRLSPADADKVPGQQDSEDVFETCPFATAASSAALAPDDILDLASVHWPKDHGPPFPSFLSTANAIVLVPWSTGPPMDAM